MAVDVHPLVRQSRTDVVLRRQWVAATGGNGGPQVRQGQQQVGGLRLQMKAGRDGRPLERLDVLVLFVEKLERRHVLPGPFDLLPAVLRQFDVRNAILLQNNPSRMYSPKMPFSKNSKRLKKRPISDYKSCSGVI